MPGENTPRRITFFAQQILNNDPYEKDNPKGCGLAGRNSFTGSKRVHNIGSLNDCEASLLYMEQVKSDNDTFKRRAQVERTIRAQSEGQRAGKNKEKHEASSVASDCEGVVDE